MDDYRVEENELLGVVSLQAKKVHTDKQIREAKNVHAKYIKIYDP